MVKIHRQASKYFPRDYNREDLWWNEKVSSGSIDGVVQGPGRFEFLNPDSQGLVLQLFFKLHVTHSSC